jgi:hypothetical protein
MLADMISIAIRMTQLPMGITTYSSGGFCEKYGALNVGCRFSEGDIVTLVYANNSAGFYFNRQLMMICDADIRSEQIWNCQEWGQ